MRMTVTFGLTLTLTFNCLFIHVELPCCRPNWAFKINTYETHEFEVRYQKHIPGTQVRYAKGPRDETYTVRFNDTTQSLSVKATTKLEELKVQCFGSYILVFSVSYICRLHLSFSLSFLLYRPRWRQFYIVIVMYPTVLGIGQTSHFCQ